MPDNWHIGVSEKGWTSDDLTIYWLKEVFDPNTRRRTVGTHRLIILNGPGSHVTPEFDKFCAANSIVVLQMPPRSSNLLQPLDVGCFAPLKIIYGRKVQEQMLAGIHHIDKQDFLSCTSRLADKHFQFPTFEVGSWRQASCRSIQVGYYHAYKSKLIKLVITTRTGALQARQKAQKPSRPHIMLASLLLTRKNFFSGGHNNRTRQSRRPSTSL